MFAVNAAGTYIGRLTISVDGGTPTVKDDQNVVMTESDIMTLTILDFSCSGYPKADVVITTSKGATGNLTLKTIKYGFLRLSAKLDDGSKVNDSNCNISLAISAVLQKIGVTFVGIK